MKRIILPMVFILLLLLTSCTGAGRQSIDWENAKWEDILAEANGTTVNIHMWGGSEQVNRYMDDYVAPQLREQLGITLNRVPIADARDLINQLITEKELAQADGVIDIMWINGENFSLAKHNQLLIGPFTGRLPNYQALVDTNDTSLLTDFGESTDELEAPWGTSQFVIVYDQSKVSNPPETFEELKAWVMENPGRFTYPAPPDFTGSAFVRHVVAAFSESYTSMLNPLENEELEAQSARAFQYLQSIEPYLWREGKTYPESSGKLDTLYSTGEVWMTMSYNPVHGSNMISTGQFPETTRSLIFSTGSLRNTHYLTIPFNSQNVPGAMATINFLLSADAQLEKFKPAVWGDGMVISTEKMRPQEAQAADRMDRGPATLSVEALQESGIPEMTGVNVELLEALWYEKIAAE